jgi:hypothetical protein
MALQISLLIHNTETSGHTLSELGLNLRFQILSSSPQYAFIDALTTKQRKFVDQIDSFQLLEKRPVYVMSYESRKNQFNPLNPELNPICYLLALLGAHHFLHISRIRVELLTFRLLMSYIYGAHILDVSRSHTTTQHSR